MSVEVGSMSLMVAVGVLAVWRLTHLLHAEDGPAAMLARLRQRLGHGPLGEVLDCFYCLSLWVALPITLLLGLPLAHALVAWLALSGGAILLERATMPRPLFREDPVGDALSLSYAERTCSDTESLDVLLRKDA
jgi:hypothetical protein